MYLTIVEYSKCVVIRIVIAVNYFRERSLPEGGNQAGGREDDAIETTVYRKGITGNYR